jgi:hypothetical protein
MLDMRDRMEETTLCSTWWGLMVSPTRNNECSMLEVPGDRAPSDSSRNKSSCTSQKPESSRVFYFCVKPVIQRLEYQIFVGD